MSEFKKGDIVTHAEKDLFPGEYRVTNPRNLGGLVEAVRVETGGLYRFTGKGLTVVKPTFKKGDRVRGNVWRDKPDHGWHEGVIKAVGTRAVRLADDDGRTRHVWTDTLEAVDFKVGDRVKGRRSADERDGGEVTGKIIAVHPDRHTFRYEYLVEVDGKPGHTAYIHKGTAVRVDDEQDLADWERELLKPIPAVGAKVRVTYEGTVVDRTPLLGGFKVKTENGKTVFVGSAKHTVEVVEPPFSYADGTVAISEYAPRSPAVRRDGKWTPDLKWGRLTDESVRDNHHFTVVHDPAAS